MPEGSRRFYFQVGHFVNMERDLVCVPEYSPRWFRVTRTTEQRLASTLALTLALTLAFLIPDAVRLHMPYKKWLFLFEM